MFLIHVFLIPVSTDEAHKLRIYGPGAFASCLGFSKKEEEEEGENVDWGIA